MIFHLLWWCVFACQSPEPIQPIFEPPEPPSPQAARSVLLERGITELSWALTPYLAADAVDQKYRPLAEYVSSKIGLPVVLTVGESYADVEKMISEGAVDLAVLAPYSMVRARRIDPDLTLLASHVAMGSPNYGAYIITREDGDIQTLDQIKGKSFAFVSTHSTSGWLFPAARLIDAGIHPLDDIDARFLGDHERVVDAVLTGQVAAGATFEDGVAQAREIKGTHGTLRLLGKTQRIPYDAYVARSGLPPLVTQALSAILCSLSTRTAEGREVLGPMQRINGLMPVTQDNYKIIDEVEEKVVQLLGERAQNQPIIPEQPARNEPPSESGDFENSR